MSIVGRALSLVGLARIKNKGDKASAKELVIDPIAWAQYRESVAENLLEHFGLRIENRDRKPMPGVTQIDTLDGLFEHDARNQRFGLRATPRRVIETNNDSLQ